MLITKWTLAGVLLVAGLSPLGCREDGSETSQQAGALAGAGVGQPAPGFTLAKLGGSEVSLADRDVPVVLDFWATWCGPCRIGLPTLDVLASDYAGRASFYAVNIKEDAETIRAFVEKTSLGMDVLMDRDARVAKSFGVEGIPHTVVIDSAGVIRRIHVGFYPDVGADIKRDLDALLAGREVADSAERRPGEDDVASNLPLLAAEKRSSQPHTGVSGHPTRSLIARLETNGKAAVGVIGQAEGSIALAANRSRIRPAQLGDGSLGLAHFQHWGREIVLVDSKGARRFHYPAPMGVDDVVAVDLDEDGADEFVIGFNGGTGVHAVDGDGAPLWVDQSIGNVWSVDAGDLLGDDRPEIVTTSAAGQVHVFDRAGTRVRDFTASIYAQEAWVVASPTHPRGRALAILGLSLESTPASTKAKAKAAMMDAEGKTLWELKVADGPMATALPRAASRSGMWLAVTVSRDEVRLIDTRSGEFVGRIPLSGVNALAWEEPADGPPVLLAATDDGLIEIHVPTNRIPSP